MLFSTNIEISGIMEALARLKDIPVAKVVRNASRDFAQAAWQHTPLAKVSRSEYYYYWRDGEKKFLHESQVGKRKRGSKLRKVRVHKGWSKASWIGIFRALGMTLKTATGRLPQAVEHISNAIVSGTQTDSKTVMTDEIRFDQFGRSRDTRTDEIAREGFKLAAKRMTSEVNKMIARQWSGQ